MLLAEAIHEAGSTSPAKIKLSLENLNVTVKGAIADWKKPWSKWNPSNVETHEAFRRANTVMGKVQNGRVVLANPAEKFVLQGTGTK